MSTCIFCGQETTEKYKDQYAEHFINCPNCGSYRITWEALEDLPSEFKRKYKGKRHLVSGYLREMNELGLDPGMINNDNIESFFINSKVPKNVYEKFDRLLLYMGRKTNCFGEVISDLDKYPAICYGVNTAELISIISNLQHQGLIDQTEQYYYLLPEGLRRYSELCKESINSNQCFVAMWFSTEMNEIYEKWIFRAITEAKSKNFYKPMRIDGKEHINKICDEIIAEIRKSKFIIADFTGQRGGVYYEAGFAHGLGVPVIWTCRKDEINNLHFDIRQYNCIIWETGEELYQKLKSRIEAGDYLIFKFYINDKSQ